MGALGGPAPGLDVLGKVPAPGLDVLGGLEALHTIPGGLDQDGQSVETFHLGGPPQTLSVNIVHYMEYECQYDTESRPVYQGRTFLKRVSIPHTRALCVGYTT